MKTVIEIGARHTGQPRPLSASFDEHSSQLTRWPQSKRVVRDADMQIMQSGKKAFVSTTCARARRSLDCSFMLFGTWCALLAKCSSWGLDWNIVPLPQRPSL